MRAVVCCLCWFALAACARDAVPLGTEGPATTGGNNSTTGGGNTTNTTGVDTPTTGDMNTGNSNEPDASSGGDNDASSTGGTECVSATCERPTAALGEIDASEAGAMLVHQGVGSAFLTLTAIDTLKTNTLDFNGTIGIKASLKAPSGSSYEVHIVGDLDSGSEPCTANDSSGTAAETTAIWNGTGPVAIAPERKLSIEVRHVDGPCDQDWTLTVTGLPCTGPTVSTASCP